MYKDILLGVGDHENGRLQQSSPLTYRTASGDLHNIIAIDLGGRIVNPIVQEFFTNHVPIDEEYGLKPVHSFPYKFEMRIPPCAPRGSLIVSVGYIHASHKPDFTVYHDNLAVVPVIHLTGENGERYPQERIYLDTRFLHFLKEAVFYIPATHIIIKHTYLHAFFYFLDKELLHLFSYLVITEYIILYMDMVGRFLDLFQQVFELIGTIRINRDLCSV